MHFVGGIGGDSQTNAPPLEAVHSLFGFLFGVQSHSLEMRSFLGNLAGRFSFSAISYRITLWRKELFAISAFLLFCYSLCFTCFILGEVPRNISELHVLKCEGGMSE